MRTLFSGRGPGLVKRPEASGLMYAIGLSVSLTACGGCRVGGGPPPASGGDLVSHPGVSAPVIAAVGRRLAAESAGAQRLMAVTTPAFDCQAFARTLIPWKGQDFTNPLFVAAGEATLPDAPEFADRRAAACSVLQTAAGAQ